ncbi:MAG: endolytic transglycosylase MltG [Patescibacteria group bacterium]
MPEDQAPLQVKKPHQKPRFWVLGITGALISIAVILAVGSFVWYQQNLQPASSSKQNIRFIVKSGEGNAKIAANLEEKGIIRSSEAMVIYLRLTNKSASLQAGTYVISPSNSVQQVVDHLSSGKTDVFNITILPGRTLTEIKKDLGKYGYSSSEVEEAYNGTYNSPLLADRPKDADLEGYIFPETFEMSASSNLHSLFQRSMDALYARLKADGSIEKFKQKGLNIHQALTLASIIQKEASDSADQPQIAQVFFTRLDSSMKLESDVTFHYGAEKLGVEPRVDLNSPYNTRLVGGLPPTPISNMNYSALQAVANPAAGDYVYFIAGDNGNIYYGRTLQEHQANIDKYCQKLCGNAF